MANLVPTLTNGSFQNWLKGALGILFAKEGLTDFVSTEFTQFQTDLLQSAWTSCGIPAGTTCIACTTANLLNCPTQGFCNKGLCKIHDSAVPEKIPNQPCPNRVCDTLMISIRKKHRYKGPSWKNTDARSWCKDPFEVAKCFLPPDGYSDIHSFEETDFNGVLSVIINNRRFQSKLAAQLNTEPNSCTNAREVGKAVRHSSDLLLTDDDLAQYITDLKCLLTDPTCLASDLKAQAAVSKLNELQTNTLMIHANDITQIIHDNIGRSISKQHQAVLQDIQSHLGTFQTASVAAITKISKKTEKKKTEINEHTGKKKQDFDKHSGLLKKSIDVHVDQKTQDIVVCADQKKQDIEKFANKKMQDIEAFMDQKKQDIEKLANQKMHDIEVHADQKKQDITLHADQKKQDITLHVDEKKQDIDVHADEKKQDIDVHANKKKQDIILHVDQKKQDITLHADQRKKDITLLADQTKQDITLHADQRKKDISLHADQTKQDITLHADQTKQNIDLYVDQKKQDITLHADLQKKDITLLADQKMQELDLHMKQKERKFAVLREKLEIETGSQIKEKECTELKEYLIGFYRYHHSKIQVSPLVEWNDVDLMEFYVKPPMTAIDLQRKIGKPQKSPVKISQQLFYRDDQTSFKNIYVTAGPGLGKTSFSQRICMAWCQAHKPLRSIAGKFQHDEVLALKGFDLLFMIPLRDAHKSLCDLDEIIRAYLQRHLPSGTYLNMMDIIFNKSSCLILLDGLDEWSHPESCSRGHNAREIPHRKFRKNWTILTTTRPWKFDEIRLSSHQIDRHVEINELDEESSNQLVINSVHLLNQGLPEDKPRKSVEDFYKTLSLIKLGDIRNIPYIYLQCECLWFEEKDIGSSRCEIYINVIELTLRRGIEKIKSGLSLPPEQADSEIHVPKCILGTQYCKQHLPLLLKLGKMAFYALFDVENRERLVFDVTFARKYLEEEEMEFCLKLGLLSQNKVYGLLSQRVSNVSFVHKSIQECFAALFMQSYNHIGEEVKNTVVRTCTSLSSILNMSNVFIFLSGFRPGVYSELSSLIMQGVSEDQNIYKYRTRLSFNTNDPEYDIMLNFQTMQVDSVEEMLANGQEFSNLHVEDILIDAKSKQEAYISVLHKLLHGNQGHIKLLSIRVCKNAEKVTQILETLDLQYLHSLYKLDLLAVARQPDVEQLLRQSISTLQYLYLGYSIYDHGQHFSKMTVLSKVCEEMILGMPLLKGLGLAGLIVTHNQLENVTTFLTSRVTMIQIHMENITCIDHDKSCPGVQFNLSGHDNLQHLVLAEVPVSQLQVNTQHLEQCHIGGLSSSVITSCLTSLPVAHNLRTLYCTNVTDFDIPTLIKTIPALSQLEELYIHNTDITDNRLDLTDMTRLRYIELLDVTMTSTALRALSRNIASQSQSVTVMFADCTVTPKVEYETVKEEIRKSDIFTVTFDGQGKYFNQFSFIKEPCLK